MEQTEKKEEIITVFTSFLPQKYFVERIGGDRVDVNVLEPLRGNMLFVFHPSFGYFADDYGLEQVAIESGGKEPGPAMFEKMIMQAREKM